MRLLLDIAPEVNARSDAGRASLLEDRFARGEEVRVVVLLRQAEAARQIVRTDEHARRGRGRSRCRPRHPWRGALDVDDQQAILRAVLDVGLQLRLRRIAIEHSLEFLSLNGPHLHRAAKRLHLLDRFDVRRDDARCAAVEDHGGRVRIGDGIRTSGGRPSAA